WPAHTSVVASIVWLDLQGKACFLVTAGTDGDVHVFTDTGAHVGTFGQRCPWSLAQRSSWQRP
ncbi:unnamed protein product, partial [Phaeothamnion confervicola]